MLICNWVARSCNCSVWIERSQRCSRLYELGGSSAGAAQLLLGHLYYQQRRFKDAERAFQQYLKDIPTAPNAPQVRTLIVALQTTKS